MGPAESGVESDGAFEAGLGRLEVLAAPVEVAQLQERLGVVRRELEVPLVGGPGLLQTLLADERRPEVGEDRGIFPIAEVERAFEARLGFGPAFDAQEQTAQEPVHPRIPRREFDRPPGRLHRFGEESRLVEHGGGEIVGLVPGGLHFGGGLEVFERVFHFPELSERLPERQPAVHELRRPRHRPLERRNREFGLPGEEPHRPDLVKRRDVPRPAHQEIVQDPGRFVSFSGSDQGRRLLEDRLRRRFLLPEGRQGRKRPHDGREPESSEGARPHETQSAPTGCLTEPGRAAARIMPPAVSS